jgi:hypothetical protein
MNAAIAAGDLPDIFEKYVTSLTKSRIVLLV